jgi:diguanylate cyclase (GGDEF)-like protein/PAS domain S-box-containing protein
MALRVLFVEDSEVDAELAGLYLSRAGIEALVERVETEAAFVHGLESFRPDLIISDFTLPRFSGTLALQLAQQKSPATPFIFVSGTIGQETAIESLKQGAADYILKDNLARLPSAVTRALQQAEDRLARDQAEAKVRDSEARLRLFLQHLPGIAFVKDMEGRYALVNAAAERAFGRPALELIGKTDADLVPSEMASQFRAMDRLAVERGNAVQCVEAMPTPSGLRQWLTTKFPMRLGELVMVGGVAIDVTERIAAEEALRLSERAVEASFDPILVTRCLGGENLILYVNAAFERVTGYQRDEVVGRDCRFLQSDDRDQPGLEEIRAAIRYGRDGHALLRNYRKDGRAFWNDLYITPVRDPQSGQVTHFVAVAHDITQTKRYQEELEHQANHDALTGLPNRNLLSDRLDQAISRARRSGQMFSVLLLDVDHFKLINDSLGHVVGDRVLRQVAERLVGCLREGDTVARLGGDEFVLVLNNQIRVDDVVHVTERIARAFGEPLVLDDQELNLTCSMGLSTYPTHGKDKETLLRNADAAMYRVKSQTRNGVHFYTEELNSASRQRFDLITSLRRALDRDEFVMHYQPQVDLRTGRIFGVEALIRWKRSDDTVTSPASFIPVAEESGLIVPIGAWTLHAACLQAKRWQDAGHQPITVAVNLSAQQFRRKGIVDTVAGVLRATGLEGRYLELELTESMMMHSVDEVIGTLRELKNLGVQLTVDDFGIGYSSLNYLKRFPVDRLKIDRSFVRDIGVDRGDTAIARAIIGLGHSLQLRVIAEGVESLDRCTYLQQFECDEAQGYYFAKPLAAADVESLLSSSPLTPVA